MISSNLNMSWFLFVTATTSLQIHRCLHQSLYFWRYTHNCTIHSCMLTVFNELSYNSLSWLYSVPLIFATSSTDSLQWLYSAWLYIYYTYHYTLDAASFLTPAYFCTVYTHHCNISAHCFHYSPLPQHSLHPGYTHLCTISQTSLHYLQHSLIVPIYLYSPLPHHSLLYSLNTIL